MSRVSWGLAIAITVFGAVGTFVQIDSYELDPATGTYDSESTGLAYFAWMVACMGAGAAVFILLSRPSPLWMDPQPAAIVRMRRACVTLSSAVFLLMFGVGSILINDALMRDPFDSTWIPLVAGMVLIVAGMLFPGRRHLWDIDVDEDFKAGEVVRAPKLVGLLVISLGLTILVVSFVVGVSVTSTHYRTVEWDDKPYTVYIFLSHLAGLLLVFGGLALYAGEAPFPHWRVKYRPPGAD